MLENSREIHAWHEYHNEAKGSRTVSVTDIHAYHKIITDSYDERSKTYNDSESHRVLAKQLVDYAPPPVNG